MCARVSVRAHMCARVYGARPLRRACAPPPFSCRACQLCLSAVAQAGLTVPCACPTLPLGNGDNTIRCCCLPPRALLVLMLGCGCVPFFGLRAPTLLLDMAWQANCLRDKLADWFKALASCASPQGRGLEPHSCQLSLCLALCRCGHVCCCPAAMPATCLPPASARACIPAPPMRARCVPMLRSFPVVSCSMAVNAKHQRPGHFGRAVKASAC